MNKLLIIAFIVGLTGGIIILSVVIKESHLCDNRHINAQIDICENYYALSDEFKICKADRIMLNIENENINKELESCYKELTIYKDSEESVK